MKIPLVDLKTQHQSLEGGLYRAFQRVLKSVSFTLGKETEMFERAFAKYCRAPYCAAVNSGTSALHLALLAHGIGSGDEVITQPNTFIATCEAISYTGAKPVFVDVEPVAFSMDVSAVEKAVTKRTKAIIPVHLAGIAVDMDKLNQIAKKHKLVVIEDACQAHGARYLATPHGYAKASNNEKIGSLGNTACFSFYPSKVLGSLGEGGAVVTFERNLYEKVKMLRHHAQLKKNEHSCIGYNYRMQELQAAFLRVKLKLLDAWVARRRRNARLYNALLKDLEPYVNIPVEPKYSRRNVQHDVTFRSNFYVYSIMCENREKLIAFLSKNGVQTQIHGHIPIHLQKAYAFLGYKRGDFPVAERQAEETLSLPMYPELQKEQIEYVAKFIHRFYNTPALFRT